MSRKSQYSSSSLSQSSSHNTQNSTPNPHPSSIRCAIYTRKSTDEGLEQEFNSLDAQREAGEAFILSQRGQGWKCIPDRYDDGGYSGGNMERPALKRLMTDIEDGKIDCIVVYKVDRLSRSLIDFSQIMGILEKKKVSFVSVTQQFNTTSSMGRLTLNILLSFAQFEREIISERTRDKIAATRRKGKWSGGIPILGFDIDPQGGKLNVNEDEAAQVRMIFELYLKRMSLVETIKELDARNMTTKLWVTKKGRERGGKLFTKNSLFKHLTNVLYIGKITYKGEVHNGEHKAIVDEEVFAKVQRLLRRNGTTGGREVRNKYGALLKGLLRCTPCDSAMVHTYTTKNNGKRYRYYVCLNAQKRGWHKCPSKSIPAQEIENFVVDQIRCIGKDETILADTIQQTRETSTRHIAKLETERYNLEQDLTQQNNELRKLAGRLATDRVAVDRVAEIRERIHKIESRATKIRDETITLENEMMDESEVSRALALFDPVWETMAPRERVRVIRLLVQRVDYDGEKGTVSVTFHPTGIKALTNEHQEAQR